MNASKVSALLSVEVSLASCPRVGLDEEVARDDALPLQPGKEDLGID